MHLGVEAGDVVRVNALVLCVVLRKVRLGANDGTVSNLARYYLARAKARLPLQPR